MRKKWTYVAIVSMMLGVAPVFTGCVDTDEPAGLEQLRGAKAQLLQAKAAVEEANAAYRLAEIEYLNAKTAQEQALAQYQEYQAELARLQVELKEAENEMLKKQYEQQIAQIEQDMKLAALQNEAAIITLQKQIAEAKRSYELLLKQIEIAEAIGSDNEIETVANLRIQLEQRYFELYGSDGMGGIAGELRDAQENLYNAQLNKLKGYDTDEYGNPSPTPVLWIPTLENNRDEAQADVTAAEEALKVLEDFKAKPVEDTDWRAEIEKIEADIETLKLQSDEIEAQIAEAKAKPEYLKKEQAVNGVYDESGVLVQNGTTQNLKEASDALLLKQQNEVLEIPAYTPTTEFDATSVMGQALGHGSDYFSYTASTYNWATSADSEPKKSSEYPAAVESVITNQYEAWLDIIDNATFKTPNEIAQAEAVLSDKKKAEEAALKTFNTAKDKWTKVLDIINKAQDYDVETTEFEKKTTAYNTAYDALNVAITNWNTQIQEAYDEAYDEKLTEETLKVKGIALTIKPVTDIAAFNAKNAQDQWKAAGTLGQQTDAQFTTIVNNNCGDDTSTAEEKAKIQQAVWAQINNYVNITTADMNWTGKAEAENAAKLAVGAGNFDKDGKLSKAITDAETKVVDAYNDLNQAISHFENLADSYAQTLTDAAEKALDPVVMAGTADKNGKYSVGLWKTSKVNNKGVTLYTIGNSKIEAAEITAATDTKFDSGKRDSALATVSNAAFGMPDRYIEPTREEIEAVTGNASAGAKYYAAVADREKQEAIISANDDLIAFGEEIEKALVDFKAQVAADYAEVFKDEQAAYDEKTAEHLAAVTALNEASKVFADLTVEQAKIDAQVKAQEGVVATLKQLVWDNLGIEWPSGTNPGQYDPESFADELDEAIEQAKQDVADAEQLLAEAEVALKEAQEGAYDGVAYFSLKVERLQAQFEQASEAYKKAQENLATALEIMAAGADSEQPAE